MRAVVLDVGETLVDETRTWGAWADWLGIPRLTFFAVLGAVIARGGDHREVFERFRPGIDLGSEAERLRAAGHSDLLALGDLYPDVRSGVAILHAHGYAVGIAGNQPATTGAVLAALDLPLEFVATSAEWGVAKPDPRFFGRIVRTLGLAPGEIAYVGDRVDNDVIPAAAAGLVAILLRRGPWGWILADPPPPEAAVVVGSLDELPSALDALAAAMPGPLPSAG